MGSSSLLEVELLVLGIGYSSDRFEQSPAGTCKLWFNHGLLVPNLVKMQIMTQQIWVETTVYVANQPTDNIYRPYLEIKGLDRNILIVLECVGLPLPE